MLRPCSVYLFLDKVNQIQIFGISILIYIERSNRFKQYRGHEAGKHNTTSLNLNHLVTAIPADVRDQAQYIFYIIHSATMAD